MSDRIGFVGLGVMGRPMAWRLSASYEVHGFDVDESRFEGLERVRAAGSVEDVAGQCPIVCLSLPSSSVVEHVVLGAEGLKAGLEEGSLVIDLSTTEPRLSQRIGRELSEAGMRSDILGMYR